MNYNKTVTALGNVDIYIIDQILKNRYVPTDTILDAGCGEGRNLKWFYNNNYNISGIDTDYNRIQVAKLKYPEAADNFSIGNLEDLPYSDNQFNHVICNAALHFASNKQECLNMFSELVRVLKPNGTLFIRMASDIGLLDAPYVKDGKTAQISSFYLTRDFIKTLLKNYSITLIEPVKTTNVADKRAMTTLVFCKL
mgnify:CR=1 FL=1